MIFIIIDVSAMSNPLKYFVETEKNKNLNEKCYNRKNYISSIS